MNSYQDEAIANEYLKFINSRNGQVQQKFLAQAIFKHLPEDRNSHILDAACGTGWLSANLKKKYSWVEGCDNSSILIDAAKKNYPEINFVIADISSSSFPYPLGGFDAAILNMAITDIEHMETAFKNLNDCLKKDGTLIVTLPNPYYQYPIGSWKQGWRKLFKGPPALRMNIPYFKALSNKKTRTWGKSQTSYVRGLGTYVEVALSNNFFLISLEDIKSERDNQEFDLQYQLYRYPLLLLLQFKKAGN